MGLESASTVVSANSAKIAVALKSASTVVGALSAGVRWCINLRAGRQRKQCKECGGSESASTVVYALSARSVARKGWNEVTRPRRAQTFSLIVKRRYLLHASHS